MVIFRENTEDIYAGIEWAAESAEAQEGHRLPRRTRWSVKKIRFPATSGIGIKPVSREGTERLVRAAIEYALRHEAQERDLRPQGQHHEVHRGRVPRLGLRARDARVPRPRRHRARDLDPRQRGERTPASRVEDNARAIDPGYDMMTPDQQAKVRAEVEAALALWPTHGDGKWKQKLLHHGLHRRHHAAAGADAAARTSTSSRRSNLNGDYLSDALAAQVGGIGIAPGGNINYVSGPRHLRGDARHGAEVRQPRQGEPGLGHPLGRDDVPPPRLGRGRGPDHQGHGRRHRRQDRDLRLRPPDGRRDLDLVLRVRRGRSSTHMQ